MTVREARAPHGRSPAGRRFGVRQLAAALGGAGGGGGGGWAPERPRAALFRAATAPRSGALQYGDNGGPRIRRGALRQDRAQRRRCPRSSMRDGTLVPVSCWNLIYLCPRLREDGFLYLEELFGVAAPCYASPWDVRTSSRIG